MERIEAKIAFFIEKKSRTGSNGQKLPKEVTAVFTDSGNIRYKDCYAHVGQHGTCGVEWVAEECRPAKYAEYKELYDELNGNVGYNIEVIDAEWWIRRAMGIIQSAQDFYEGQRDIVA